MHGAEFRRKGRPDARSEHDTGEQGAELARKSNCHQTGDQPFCSEALQLVAGQQRHGEAEEKGNESHQRHRIHTGTFGMAKETGGTKRDASVLNPLERFFERVHNEPEHAAYFPKKIARGMADSLGNQNGGRFSVRHGPEVASLRHWEKRKVLRR